MQISDNQFNKLRETTQAAKPMYNKLAAGDIELSQDDIANFTKAYDSWQRVVDSTRT